jgi:hypothetical protein
VAEPYEIRRVEQGAGVDLLPEAAQPYLWSCAFRGTGQGHVGALLLAKMPAGTRVLIRMAEGRRDGDLERALLDAALATAQRRGIRALLSWQPERQDSKEAKAWLERGFEPRNQRMIVEADAAAAVENCKRQMARVRNRVRVPADARVVPLREAPMAQVGRLKVLAFGGKARDTVRRAQEEGPGSFDRDLSLAMMAGAKVAGIALGTTREKGMLYGEAIAIDPAFRGRWALPLLKGEWFCRALELGIRRIHGEIAVANAVSRKVFRRDGFEEVAIVCDFVRGLGGGPGLAPEPAKATVIVATAPGLDDRPLCRRLQEVGVEAALGTEQGLLRSLPQADWWSRAAGGFVRLPFVLLSALPEAGEFRILVTVPGQKDLGARYATELRRAAAQLRLRPNCEVIELDQNAEDEDLEAACRDFDGELST